MNKAIVIGSGIAGLASAIRLAHKGYAVEVFEANSYPGGKLSEFSLGAYRFDAGPSLFTLPELVDELFELTGKDPKDYFSYFRKKESCRYFWNDGSDFIADANAEKFAKEAASFFKVEEKAILNYLQDCRRNYDTAAPVFLEMSLHKWKNYFSSDVLKGIAQMHRLHLFSSMDQVNQKAFSHPRLVQLFNRFATYNGSDPYRAPGVLTMIPHLEFNLGTYLPKGGMNDITRALYGLAIDLGVQFHFNKKVRKIATSNGGVTGVEVDGELHAAPLVICNMDVVPAYRQLLKHEKAPERTLAQERSSSALIFYWGIKKSFPQLGLHNIFFSDDYQKEFETLFNSSSIHNDPTVYVNITSKDVPGDAPEGCENWFVMINVPGNKGQEWDKWIPEARKSILKKLSAVLKEDIASLIEEEDFLDPRRIESKTSSFQGSLYGSASNNRNAAFFRHPNFSRHIEGLYFCGGSVHPGGGVPLCLLSGKITAGLIPDAQ